MRTEIDLCLDIRLTLKLNTVCLQIEMLNHVFFKHAEVSTKEISHRKHLYALTNFLTSIQ